MELPRPRNPKYVALLALAAGTILIAGSLARPRQDDPTPPPLPSQGELEQLARRTDRRALESMFRSFTEGAGQVESSVVRIPGTQSSGVVWDVGLVLTTPLAQATSEAVTVATRAGQRQAQLVVWGPHLPLALLRSPDNLSGLVPARRLRSTAQPGEWIVAVWRTDREPAFAPAYFLQTSSITCGDIAVEEVVSSAALTPAMAGGGLFDFDGNLHAVILTCDDRITAIAAPSIDSILENAETLEHRMLAEYGVAFGALTEEHQTYFETTDGLIVREIWTGHLGDKAGLRPGDIVGALDEQPILQIEDLGPLVTPRDGQPFDLLVQRGSQTLNIALLVGGRADDPAAEPVGGSGLLLETPERNFRIDAVLPDSPAAIAGIEPGDRLVRIDRAEPQSVAQIQRLLAGEAALPVFLEVERHGRRWGVLLAQVRRE